MAIRLINNFNKQQKGILQEPDERLRLVSEQVVSLDKKIEKIGDQLIIFLKKVDRRYKPWIGMAANQIGYDKRIIAIKNSYHDYTVMINPEIVSRKWNFYTIAGCFSLKGLYLIKRYLWQKVRYQDLQGKKHEKMFRGGYAAVLQQEIDHLNGRLICD